MDGSQKLLNMISEDKEWHVRDTEGSHGVTEEKRLELRLAPPGEDQSLLSLGYTFGSKRGFVKTVEGNPEERKWLAKSTEIQCQKLTSSEKPKDHNNNVFTSTWSCGPLPSPAFQSPPKLSQATNSAVPNTSHKRFIQLSCSFLNYVT